MDGRRPTLFAYDFKDPLAHGLNETFGLLFDLLGDLNLHAVELLHAALTLQVLPVMIKRRELRIVAVAVPLTPRHKCEHARAHTSFAAWLHLRLSI
jgi:hypothetical protein